MPKALKLDRNNVGRVIGAAELLGRDLSYLPDEMVCNADLGYYTYLITDGDTIRHNLSYTTLTDVDFDRIWKFAYREIPDTWCEIERV